MALEKLSFLLNLLLNQVFNRIFLSLSTQIELLHTSVVTQGFEKLLRAFDCHLCVDKEKFLKPYLILVENSSKFTYALIPYLVVT